MSEIKGRALHGNLRGCFACFLFFFSRRGRGCYKDQSRCSASAAICSYHQLHIHFHGANPFENATHHSCYQMFSNPKPAIAIAFKLRMQFLCRKDTMPHHASPVSTLHLYTYPWQAPGRPSFQPWLIPGSPNVIMICLGALVPPSPIFSCWNRRIYLTIKVQ